MGTWGGRYPRGQAPGSGNLTLHRAGGVLTAEAGNPTAKPGNSAAKEGTRAAQYGNPGLQCGAVIDDSPGGRAHPLGTDPTRYLPPRHPAETQRG